MAVSSIAENIRSRREAKGWTQEDLRARAKTSVAMIEAGLRKNPSIDVLSAIARALGCTVDELVKNRKAV